MPQLPLCTVISEVGSCPDLKASVILIVLFDRLCLESVLDQPLFDTCEYPLLMDDVNSSRCLYFLWNATLDIPLSSDAACG